MEIEGAGGFEHSVHFEQSVGHHGEIGHHVVGSEELPQGDHHLGHFGMLALLQFGKLALGLFAPMPGVLEGGDLRVGFVSLRGFEEHGIIALRIKRRIEINKIDRFPRDVFAENIEVVVEIKLIQDSDLSDYSGLEQDLGNAVYQRNIMGTYWRFPDYFMLSPPAKRCAAASMPRISEQRPAKFVILYEFNETTPAPPS